MGNITDLVYRNTGGVPVTTSVIVADYFEKNHKHVMEAIQDILVMAEKSALTEIQEISSYFELSSYETPLNNGTGAVRKYPMYIMNEKGFTHLAMGFTGEKARVFKQRYIKAFEAMRNTIQQGIPQIDHLQQQFMETQIQMMNQMMKLCSNMMDRVEKLEQKQLPPTKEEPADKHGVSGWDTSFMRTSSSRRQFTDYITVKEAARELGRRGLYIFQATLYEYLRNNGYTSKDENRYNCPESHCIRKGWMVSVNAGTNKSNHFGRRYFTPYLSPEFVDKLESELRMMKCSDPAGYQLTLPLGKEVGL